MGREANITTRPPARVLVIDDDEDIRDLIRVALESSGREAVEASNGRDAVKLAARERFDLVVIDIVMPEQEGIETIGILKKMHPGVPIMAISGVSGLYLELAGRMGAVATVAKPFSCEVIGEAMESVLRRSR